MKIKNNISSAIIAFIWVMLLPFAAMTQSASNPGFMGKRTMLGYKLSLCPVGNFTPRVGFEQGEFPSERRNGSKLMHSLEINRILNKRTGLAFTTDYYQGANSLENSVNNTRSGNFREINAYAMGLALDLYSYRRKGLIAPMGWVMRLTAKYIHNSNTIHTFRGSVSVLENPEKYSYGAFGIGLHRQYFLTNSILISVGAKSELVAFSLGDSILKEDQEMQLNRFNRGLFSLQFHTGLSYLF